MNIFEAMSMFCKHRARLAELLLENNIVFVQESPREISPLRDAVRFILQGNAMLELLQMDPGGRRPDGLICISYGLYQKQYPYDQTNGEDVLSKAVADIARMATQEKLVAIALSQHARVGALSPMRVLNPELLGMIAQCVAVG